VVVNGEAEVPEEPFPDRPQVEYQVRRVLGRGRARRQMRKETI